MDVARGGGEKDGQCEKCRIGKNWERGNRRWKEMTNSERELEVIG